MVYTFRGGIHPGTHSDPGFKAATNTKPIEALPAPEQVILPVSMHIGAPAKPIVKKGDIVDLGQMIAEAGGFVSAPVHATVSGKVVAVEPRLHPNGSMVMSIVIENDGEDRLHESVHPYDFASMSNDERINLIWSAGMVGHGGATFPTHVKIKGAIGTVDTVIVNAAECEPYITSDHRIMLEMPEQVIGGAKLLAQAFGVAVHIGVEDNKMDAVEVLRQEIAKQGVTNIVVDPEHTRYPQGAEKQLIQAITGRQVPGGKLPADVGCAVFNVDTTCAIYRAVTTGMPLIRRIVTVAGSGTNDPKNLEVRIGTPLKCVFDACGGVKENTYKILMGGPMMGVAQYNMDAPIGKGTNALLAFCDKEEKTVANPVCIRCGKCVTVCPMHLEPLVMNMYANKNRLEELEAANVFDCIECGSCSYICPGRVHLVHNFRTGKQKINNKRAAERAAAEAAAKAEAK